MGPYNPRCYRRWFNDTISHPTSHDSIHFAALEIINVLTWPATNFLLCYLIIKGIYLTEHWFTGIISANNLIDKGVPFVEFFKKSIFCLVFGEIFRNNSQGPRCHELLVASSDGSGAAARAASSIAFISKPVPVPKTSLSSWFKFPQPVRSFLVFLNTLLTFATEHRIQSSNPKVGSSDQNPSSRRASFRQEWITNTIIYPSDVSPIPQSNSSRLLIEAGNSIITTTLMEGHTLTKSITSR